MIIGVFLEIALMIFSGLVAAATFLITHFDFTNSILFSGMIQLLTIKQEITTPVRWIMFLGIFLVCLILQHTFKAGRIIFTVFSVLVFGILGYGWKTYDTKLAQYLAMAVWMLVAGMLNYVRWVTMKDPMIG